MNWIASISKHLYLRIWLAVVLGVAVLMLVVGWAWSLSVEHVAHNGPQGVRELQVRNDKGELITAVPGQLQRGVGVNFEVTLPDGQTLNLLLPRRPPAAGQTPGLGADGGGAMGMGNGPRDLSPWWARPPYGFVWMLVLVGLAVAIGVYPIVRKLTQRLESLQQGVQRWGEGDLTVRMPEQGQDEVADLSKRFNAAAERIQHLMSSQQSLLNSQRSLLANASHELRSPLTRIRMGLEFLGADNSNGAKQEIARNIAELDQLIDEILLASRLDAQEADLGTVEAVDLMGLCAEECARVGAVLEVQTGVQSLEMHGVVKLMRRLIRNLLENAGRYGAINGPEDVHVMAAVTDHEVVLTVSDRGPGVPHAFRQKIFEPFFRLPGASEKAGSVGLGLSLVKSIAERHHGQVTCEDREGGGASFVVRLPKL
ncbi:HAMP domain-containing sensor histidine kinase [Limnohabitans sp. 103DPR2]|uniref:HAMP domain-containing sensor histidine kinase n=1 Tax=Limnohabitans sp. 103DPR2 TaxID=1678129 RepID=UPI0006DC38DF|nr:HAMP domain-containing sensor histidine kinase [Limnohabitans sp. 103DPR2]ALK90829.1 Sensor protein RstB [Limnohabitans sp. 103DPR2]